MTAFKSVLNALLSPLNLTITKKRPNQACTLDWIEEARKNGLEINDFIEKDQRKPALLELEKLVFPLIKMRSAVCELGPGTGVYTRHLNRFVKEGEFHIVDNDPYAIEFLKTYLPNSGAIHFHLNSGTSLPFATGTQIDLIFCASMFTGSNLSFIYRYIQEFSRVLKVGGYCVFDYFNVSTEAGWQALIKNMARENPVFAYNFHGTDVINKILSQFGFTIVDRYPTIRGSVFITAQKI